MEAEDVRTVRREADRREHAAHRSGRNLAPLLARGIGDIQQLLLILVHPVGETRNARGVHHEAQVLLANIGHQPVAPGGCVHLVQLAARSEEHTSELQSLMRISYAVLCWKKKKTQNTKHL